MSEILEIIMLICFGFSWPINVVKAYKARTTKGKSVIFISLILLGYVAGISAKFTSAEYMQEIGTKWYVLLFYFLNFTMVTLDLIMYIRNYRLDKKREAEIIEKQWKMRTDGTHSFILPLQL